MNDEKKDGDLLISQERKETTFDNAIFLLDLAISQFPKPLIVFMVLGTAVQAVHSIPLTFISEGETEKYPLLLEHC